MAGIQIRGAIPPMLTPFKEDETVDYDAHLRNMEKWRKEGLGGYLVLGSNSETCYLTEDEKLKLVELTVKAAGKEGFVLAGTGMESARETIYLTNRAARLGAHAALILTPFYYGGMMTDAALIAYYTRLADASDIPILIYNVTKFTHVNISAAAVKVLARHPNIVGMKDSSGDIPQLVRFKSVIPDDFNLMTGTAAAWFPALTLGVKAGIMALANCAPGACVKVQQAYDAGDTETARKIYERVFPVNTAVTATYGIAGLKYASELTGYSGGAVRNPLLPLSEDQKVKIREILSAAGLI